MNEIKEIKSEIKEIIKGNRERIKTLKLNESNFLDYLKEDLIEIRHEYYYILEEEKRLFIFEYKEKEDQKRKREGMLEEYRKDEQKIKDNKERIKQRINRYIELLRKEELEDLELGELGAIEDKYHRLIYFSRIDPVDPILKRTIKTLRTLYYFERMEVTQEQKEALHKMEKKVQEYFMKNKEQIKDHGEIILGTSLQLVDLLRKEDDKRIPQELVEELKRNNVFEKIDEDDYFELLKK